MLRLSLLLADIGTAADLKVEPVPPVAHGYLNDILLVIGVAAILALSLFLVVYMTRRNRRSHAGTGARAIYRAEKKELDAAAHEHKGRRRRKRKEEFSQRNPTLGETGGLPPVRAEEPAEPAP